MAKGLSKQAAAAARSPHKAHGQMNSRAFASTVWPQETEDFSSFHGQAEAIESTQAPPTGETAILLCNIVELEHDAHSFVGYSNWLAQQTADGSL
jgi:hypothetical protein